MLHLNIQIIPSRRILIPNFLICTFWFCALYPGRLGADYSALLEMIRRGSSTDWWTAVYYWFFRVTSFDGHFPAVTAGLQLIILATSINWLINSLPGLENMKRRVVVIFLCTPMFGFFGMTISHDLTQTVGIILLCGIEIRRLGGESTRKFGLIYVLGITLVLTAHSGVLIAITTLMILAIRRLTKILFLASLATFICIFASNIGVVKSLDVQGVTLNTSLIKYWPSLNVLKCIAQHPMAEISKEEWAVLLRIAPMDAWRDPVSCSNFDISVNRLGLNNVAKNEKLFSSTGYITTYLGIFAKNPTIGVMAHIQRARGVLPPLLFQPPDNMVPFDVTIPVGEGTNTALQKGPSLFHPSNDFPGETNAKPKIFRALEIPAQASAFLVNQASWFWGWGGLWLCLAFFALLVIFKPLSVFKILGSLYPLLLMHSALLYFIPSSQPRYYMYSIIMGLILSIYLIIAPHDKRRLCERN